jgi:hypothetical protein
VCRRGTITQHNISLSRLALIYESDSVVGTVSVISGRAPWVLVFHNARGTGFRTHPVPEVRLDIYTPQPLSPCPRPKPPRATPIQIITNKYIIMIIIIIII